MEASHPFSDSDITSAGFYYPDSPPCPPVPPAEVAALSLLSKHLASLLRAPTLEFCSDASIFVRSVGEESPRSVRVHRCVLAARSPFFRDKFAEGAKELELEKLVGDFEVGLEALQTVIQYVYTGRLEELPVGVAECVDESYCRHEACWPAVHFMLQVLHAASTFDINELVSVFQRRLLDILEKVATDDILSVLFVANLSKRFCQRLVDKCIRIVVESDINCITLEKKLPPDVVCQIKQLRSDWGLNGRQNGIPDKHEKSIFSALDLDDIELVKMLLDEGNTNLDDAKALHYAVGYCDLKITKELLDLNRADVNGRDHRNYTVLHMAAMRKEPEIIMSLLTKGAQPFETTPDGRTALQIAKRRIRYMDYCRLTEQCKPSPKERLTLCDVHVYTGTSISMTFLLVFGMCICMIYQRRKHIQSRKRYFSEDGGMQLLEEMRKQSLAFRIFSKEELERATNRFDKNRILGQGGYGTVYKGDMGGNQFVSIK